MTRYDERNTLDQCRMKIIDLMCDKDPQVAATARLTRDLLNVIESWYDDVEQRKIDLPTLMLCSMNGAMTLIGSVMMQAYPEKRAEVHRMLRSRLLERYDELGKQICEDGE